MIAGLSSLSDLVLVGLFQIRLNLAHWINTLCVGPHQVRLLGYSPGQQFLELFHLMLHDDFVDGQHCLALFEQVFDSRACFKDALVEVLNVLAIQLANQVVEPHESVGAKVVSGYAP